MPPLPFLRPRPMLQFAGSPVDSAADPTAAVAALQRGEALVVTDAFATGTAILDALSASLGAPADDASFEARRAFRTEFEAIAARLLVPFENHQLAWPDAPPIGFLPDLYPDSATFALPFERALDLARAWEHYERGVHLAVLGHRLHPFYGTYVPTRTTHLELFATWISQHEGPRGHAIDVGTGSGVLALLLARGGWRAVTATDDNPNAVESVRRELKQLSPPPSVRPVQANLFPERGALADLIVFNPPWVKGPTHTPIERALNYQDGLFEAFFEQAHARLTPEGRVVVVFSNILTLVQPEEAHPLLAELDRGRFVLQTKLTRRVKPTRSADGRRRKTRERVEVWEFGRA